ncbi:MAG TPA: hypothetical protein VIT23_06885, partial [Terrimicrobiaceae bacterium]
MRRSRIIILTCVLVVIAALALWLKRSRAPGSSSLTEAERRKEVLKQVTDAYNTPVTFYGRVVDQYGDPVSAARVSYGAIDRFLSKGSDYTGYSDRNGYFSKDGIKGIALVVGVWKEGYYGVDGKSAATFAYGINPDSTRSLPPTKDRPAIFLLHKMGETEPLAHASGRQYKVAKDGQPMEVDLETGSQVPAGKGDIRFERWANDHVKDKSGLFDWRFRITVPDGGIAERQDQFAFEAPKDGYQSVTEINMPASLGENWNYIVNKSYFIRIRDGRYARINATIYGGHNNSLVL